MSHVEKLSDTMGKALRGLDLRRRMREGRAMALWPVVAGDATAAKAKPLYVNRGTMVVAVTSSAWANQLNLLKPRLLAMLAQHCGAGIIQDLRWRVCEWENGQPIVPDAPRSPRVKGRAPDVPLSPEQEAALAQLLSPIDDPKLAATMARVLQAQAKRRARMKALGWVSCKRCGVLHDQGAQMAIEDGLGQARLCPACRIDLKGLFE